MSRYLSPGTRPRLLKTIPGFHPTGVLRTTNFVPDKIVPHPLIYFSSVCVPLAPQAVESGPSNQAEPNPKEPSDIKLLGFFHVPYVSPDTRSGAINKKARHPPGFF